MILGHCFMPKTWAFTLPSTFGIKQHSNPFLVANMQVYYFIFFFAPNLMTPLQTFPSYPLKSREGLIHLFLQKW